MHLLPSRCLRERIEGLVLVRRNCVPRQYWDLDVMSDLRTWA